MRRARLGDVYGIKVPNGYKVYQWAYSDKKRGDFIRVFDGLYDEVPNNIEEIVLSPHSYIIPFYAARAYRIGLAEFLGNYEVPEQYPLPNYQVRFWINYDQQKVHSITVTGYDNNGKWIWETYDVSRIADLPKKYRDTTLLASCVTPNWLLYLFDNGFDLLHPERFSLGPNPEQKVQIYTDMVNEKLESSRRG